MILLDKTGILGRCWHLKYKGCCSISVGQHVVQIVAEEQHMDEATEAVENVILELFGGNGDLRLAFLVDTAYANPGFYRQYSSFVYQRDVNDEWKWMTTLSLPCSLDTKAVCAEMERISSKITGCCIRMFRWGDYKDKLHISSESFRDTEECTQHARDYLRSL